MRLERVILENFGVYARQKFEFDQAPLVLVYGPNESGKTTALNGLRNAMFGFPTRTAYLTGKPMSAEVFGTLANGTPIQFSRKKARKDEVAGKSGSRRLSSDEVAQLLGNMDLESYQQLFGFSLDELREGESSLKNAKLSEALAGGGMGGANVLQLLRTDLGNTVSGLFKSRGGSSIATLLGEIRLQQDTLKQLQVLPAEVEGMRLKLQQISESRHEAKSRYAELHLQLARAERLQQALPKLQELRRLEQALHSTEVPSGVDATFIAQWSDYAQQLTKLTQLLQTESSQLAQEQSRIESLVGSSAAFSNEPLVEGLGHQASEIPKLREREEELRRQFNEASIACARALQTLGVDSASDGLMSLAVSAPQRSELESWAAEFEKASQDLLSVTAKLESTTEQLQQLRTDDELDLPDNLSQLRELIAKIGDEEAIQEQLIESVCQKCESPDYEVLGARLRSRLPDCPALDYSWPIPSSQDVARHLRLLEESQRSMSQWQREIHRLETGLAATQRELAELQGENEQSTWGELKSIAQQRDETIDGWIDELMEPLLAHSITVEQQKVRLQQLKLLHQRADNLLLQLADTAETLAKISQVNKQTAALQAELASTQTLLDQQRATQQELESQWKVAWQNCPFAPLPPEAMMGWVSDFESWSRVSAELDIERRKMITSRAKLKQWRNELSDAWPTIIPPDAPLNELRTQLEKWTQAAGVSRTEAARVAAAQTILGDLQHRQTNLRSRQSELHEKYREWLIRHDLPSEWPLAQVTLLIDSTERLRREQHNKSRYDAQLNDVQKRIHDFEHAVFELSKTQVNINPALAPETIARGWLATLQSNRKDAAERAKLTSSIEHRTLRIKEMTARQADIEGRLAVLSNSLDVDEAKTHQWDRASFDALMQRAQQATEMRIQCSELLSTLETLAAKEPLDYFLQTLDINDSSSLSLHISELKRDLSQCESLRQHIDQEVGALTNQLEQLAQSDAAQRGQQQLHALRGQLTELAEQWVFGRLAQELLTRCIDRFTRDHEPALLQLTHRFLSSLTGGRYSTVEYDPANSGRFVVLSARGEAFEPSRLSTGTREQLYLAIRMAFITHYAEHHEPLPVLMDDCLVNFDDERSRNALKTLLGWDGKAQTVLLSCHGRTVQQLAELAPETPVICLDRNSTLPARELVSELAILSLPRSQSFQGSISD